MFDLLNLLSQSGLYPAMQRTESNGYVEVFVFTYYDPRMAALAWKTLVSQGVICAAVNLPAGVEIWV